MTKTATASSKPIADHALRRLIARRGEVGTVADCQGAIVQDSADLRMLAARLRGGERMMNAFLDEAIVLIRRRRDHRARLTELGQAIGRPLDAPAPAQWTQDDRFIFRVDILDRGRLDLLRTQRADVAAALARRIAAIDAELLSPTLASAPYGIVKRAGAIDSPRVANLLQRFGTRLASLGPQGLRDLRSDFPAEARQFITVFEGIIDYLHGDDAGLDAAVAITSERLAERAVLDAWATWLTTAEAKITRTIADAVAKAVASEGGPERVAQALNRIAQREGLLPPGLILAKNELAGIEATLGTWGIHPDEVDDSSDSYVVHESARRALCLQKIDELTATAAVALRQDSQERVAAAVAGDEGSRSVLAATARQHPGAFRNGRRFADALDAAAHERHELGYTLLHLIGDDV
jgi:hypothetical protein